jgi:two-component system, NarL family, sensor histidine kinase UhpB
MRMSVNPWGISARLITIAIVPAFVMFLVVAFALYFSSIREVSADVQARGRAIVAALADSSRYAVVSGNTAELLQILQQVLANDQSVVGVAVLDPQEKILTAVGDTAGATGSDTFTISAPILIGALNVDLFSASDSLHVQSSGGALAKAAHVAGYAKVVVSPASLLSAKRHQIYISIFVVFCATLASGVIGLLLAQRVRGPVLEIVSALRLIRKGNYDIQFDSEVKGDLAEIEKIVVEMASNLKAATQSLEEQVRSRTAELEEAINRLHEADAERRRLIAHGHEMVEEERRRIAIEIHDSLNAALISIRLWTADIASKAADGDSTADIEKSAERILSTVDTLYGSARSLVKQLRPETIDMLGLRGAIEEMVRHYDELHPGCRFELRVGSDFPKLDEQLAIAAYRLVQEALSNVVKHSKATTARVLLEKGSESCGVRIIVEDNGCGFDPRSKSSGFGLIGMRERVASVGGHMTIARNALDRGVKLVIELPLDRGR